MEMPGLMSVLARLPLPLDAQTEIKKLLQISTPTARLIKQLQFHRDDDALHIKAKSLSVATFQHSFLTGYWTAPPLLPDIEFEIDVYAQDSMEISSYCKATGEPNLMWYDTVNIYEPLESAEEGEDIERQSWRFLELEELAKLQSMMPGTSSLKVVSKKNLAAEPWEESSESDQTTEESNASSDVVEFREVPASQRASSAQERPLQE